MKIIVALILFGAAVLAEAEENCYEDPCQSGICRMAPQGAELECRIDFCNGGAAWYVGDEKIDCANTDCFKNPCKKGICRMAPYGAELECRIDYCNGGTAAWYAGDEKVDCDKCERGDEQTCPDECAGATCPNYANENLNCRTYNCGMCRAEFFLPGTHDPVDCY